MPASLAAKSQRLEAAIDAALAAVPAELRAQLKASFDGVTEEIRTSVAACTNPLAAGNTSPRKSRDSPVTFPHHNDEPFLSSTMTQLQLPPVVVTHSKTDNEPQPSPNTGRTTTGFSLGKALAAGMALICESVMVQIQASRFCVIVRAPRGGLHIAFDCGGPNGGRVLADAKLPLHETLLQSVMDTGVAASLPTLSLEDLGGDRGTDAVVRNALVMPLHAFPVRNEVLGVVVAVHARRSGAFFSVHDEVRLHAACPTIAYLVSRYPVDWVRHGYDPAPLHRHHSVPVPSLNPHPGGGPLTSDMAEQLLASLKRSDPHGNSLSLAPPTGPMPPSHMVYRRDGTEKFIRREALKELAEPIPAEGDRHRVLGMDVYIREIEECWKAAIERCMKAEADLKQKQALITDAVDIISKKQRKVDMLTEVLADHLKTDEERAKEAAEAAKLQRMLKYKPAPPR